MVVAAVDDRLIRMNPCRIKGASVERSPERPVLTVAEVYAVAGAMPKRYRLMVLLATFCSLRFGELALWIADPSMQKLATCTSAVPLWSWPTDRW